MPGGGRPEIENSEKTKTGLKPYLINRIHFNYSVFKGLEEFIF
jgi:hypothetical protein